MEKSSKIFYLKAGKSDTEICVFHIEYFELVFWTQRFIFPERKMLYEGSFLLIDAFFNF